MDYKIEKNIPITERNYTNKYPFQDMEVGDSFIIGQYDRMNMTKYSNAARSWANYKKLDWKFIVRKQEDNTVRIWRVK